MVKSDRDNLLFLWTIMKQHARSLTFTDWSSVAADHDMTKPHAARMRFFRLRKELMADEPGYITKIAQHSKDQAKDSKPVGSTRKRARKAATKAKGKFVDDEFSNDDEPLKDYTPDLKKQKGLDGNPIVFAQNLTPSSFGDHDLKQECIKKELPMAFHWHQEFPIIKREEHSGYADINNTPTVKSETDVGHWTTANQAPAAIASMKDESSTEDSGAVWMDPIPDNDSGFWSLGGVNEQGPN